MCCPSPGVGLFVRLQTSMAAFSWVSVNSKPIFDLCLQAGNIATHEMYRTFNMGVGMVVIVSPDHAQQALATDGAAFALGTVVSGQEIQFV